MAGLCDPATGACSNPIDASDPTCLVRNRPFDAPRVDALVSVDGAATVVTPPFGTAGENELLLAFVASSGGPVQAATVTGGGLAWSLVRRANAQSGSAEIWKAISPGPLRDVTIQATQGVPGGRQTLTVVALLHASDVGASAAQSAASGAPSARLSRSTAGSAFFAVGTSSTGASAPPTLRSDLRLLHALADPAGVEWVERLSPDEPAPAIAVLDVLAPATGATNFAAVEVLPVVPAELMLRLDDAVTFERIAAQHTLDDVEARTLAAASALLIDALGTGQLRSLYFDADLPARVTAILAKYPAFVTIDPATGAASYVTGPASAAAGAATARGGTPTSGPRLGAASEPRASRLPVSASSSSGAAMPGFDCAAATCYVTPFQPLADLAPDAATDLFLKLLTLAPQPAGALSEKMQLADEFAAGVPLSVEQLLSSEDAWSFGTALAQVVGSGAAFYGGAVGAAALVGAGEVVAATALKIEYDRAVAESRRLASDCVAFQRDHCCGGVPLTCPAGRVCDPATRACIASDLCALYPCPAPPVCFSPGTCSAGTCSYAPAPDGTFCTDPATQANGACRGGSCVTTGPEACGEAPDRCHLKGVIDPQTDECVYLPKYCAPPDACQASNACDLFTGACEPVPKCQFVHCNPDTGACSLPTSRASGDPHIQTHDGTYYDFQFVGEFVAATDGGAVTIQARLRPYGTSRTVAVVGAIAADVGGDRVEIDAAPGAPVTWVDGAASGPGITLPHGGALTQDGIAWPDGTALAVKNHGTFLDVVLYADPARELHGILGDQDGNPANDFRLRDGTVVARPLSATTSRTFADSWRITAAESLFRYGPGQDTTTFTDLTFPEGVARASALPPDVYASARATCVAGGVAHPVLLDACILDVGTTGDPAFVVTGSPLGFPSAADPAIYDLTVDPLSLRVDRVGPHSLSPDAAMDGVFDVTLQGPVQGLTLVTADDQGRPAYGQYWDTFTSGIWFLGVEEDGVLLGRSSGTLLPEGLHHLKLYAADSHYFVAGQRFRLSATLPDGTTVPGPVMVYAAPP